MTQKQFPTEMKTFRVPISHLTDPELHDCMVEEASEVIKALCKAERFGDWSSEAELCFDRKKAPDRNNAKDILAEFEQLLALMDEYRMRNQLRSGPNVPLTRLVLRETM